SDKVRYGRHVQACGQFAQGLAAGTAGAHVAHEAGELVVQRPGRSLGHSLTDGAVQIEPRLDTQRDEVEHEGQGIEGLAAARVDAITQPYPRNEVTRRDAGRHEPLDGQREGVGKPPAETRAE